MRVLFFLFLFIHNITYAQKFTVTGKVVNSKLEVLTGASITLDEFTEGTSSDNNGEFDKIK